jgi:2-amino-4-hydroxy-6-hydroxymethyldihydropteridine diphosphokinase
MKYGIALGSNLGDRLAHLKRAMGLILELPANVRLLAAAPVYETRPLECPAGSQLFYNSVIEIEAEIEPLVMLRALQGIETKLGRPIVHEHNSPRTVDLDILYADGIVMTDSVLMLPHPRLQHRRFVLQPLADIRPALVVAGETRSVVELLMGLGSDDQELGLVVQVSSKLTE